MPELTPIEANKIIASPELLNGFYPSSSSFQTVYRNPMILLALVGERHCELISNLEHNSVKT